jgi:hypothetical protein
MVWSLAFPSWFFFFFSKHSKAFFCRKLQGQSTCLFSPLSRKALRHLQCPVLFETIQERLYGFSILSLSQITATLAMSCSVRNPIFYENLDNVNMAVRKSGSRVGLDLWEWRDFAVLKIFHIPLMTHAWSPRRYGNNPCTVEPGCLRRLKTPCTTHHAFLKLRMSHIAKTGLGATLQAQRNTKTTQYTSC